MRDVNLQGSAGRLQKRRISEKTCELFKAYKDGEQLRSDILQQRWITSRRKNKN